MGLRALDFQERAVEQLRSRTGTLLAAASLTASFLGAQSIQHSKGIGTLGLLALLSTVASITLCVYVLLPKRGFVFSLSAPRLYEELLGFADDETEEGEIHRRLVYWLETYWQANQDKIDELGRYYLAATLALLLQLALWAWALADTLQ